MKLKRIGALVTTLALTFSLATAAPARAASFTDIDGHWAKDYIERMAEQGYAKGYLNSDGVTYSFAPDRTMTAAETLLFCARATGVDAATQKKIAADRQEEMEATLPVNIQSWTTAEMAVAVETGVLSLSELEALSQTDPTSVKTDSEGNVTSSRSYLEGTITRENICMYLVRAMGLEPLARSLTNYPLTYTDADEIAPALQPYVYVLTNCGVVNGVGNGLFDPKGAVNRGQMITMLSRTLDYMEERGIVTELSEYTTYQWEAGTITASLPGAAGTILTIESPISGVKSYSLSDSVKIYEDNMLTSVSALKSGKYVRLNFTSGGAVKEARLGGTLSTFTGTVSDLTDGKLSLLVDGQVKNLTIDRFTEVQVGAAVGDRSIVDEEAGYSSAACYVDGTGHLAGVVFSGGTYLVEGLVESVSTDNNVTTLGLTAFNGVVYRYTVSAGAAVTVNGVLGNLTAAQVGKYVQIRVSNDTGEAASVAVDTVSNYIQGPIKRTGTIGTAKSATITDQSTGQEVTCSVSESAVITYDGVAKTRDQIEPGWYVTVLTSGIVITRMEAYPASVTVEGALSRIDYSSITTLEVTKTDGSVVSYALDVNDLPTITRDGKSSSIEKLRKGDSVLLTIRYNEVERIDATGRSANLTGTITTYNETTGAVTITVALDGGGEETYTLNSAVSVTQNGVSSNIYSLRAGYAVGLVTDADQVVSIEVLSTGSSASQLTGTVYTVNTSGVTRTMTLLLSDSASPVTVDVKNAKLMDMRGSTLSVSSFTVGDSVIVYGSYDGAAFVATIVIKQ